MTTVALLRAVNVGGAGRLPMAVLREALEAAGAEEPRTYIQSGNAVFRGTAEATEILHQIETRAGFRPELLLIPADVFLYIRDANPFPEAADDPKSLHVFFLSEPSPAPEADLATAAGETESVRLTERALYLHAPDGIGRSRFVARVERLLKVPVTARNWRTIDAIAGMIESGA
ncbi:DUF1697 domain-containing protein [Silicimonas algicola]|uniref:Uncharacterized protein (DUF1697 family) n=1 Tax=Silicimonas algicola TaxID=1826607 RepID=A0A316G9C2_9RHOB|nr:DUF1697 domain-containing protein [Silicimonas algicola]AZQ65658.1 DUF1697 domain-containing protein [Silicimonas algicola]PWK56596.1 uncharacterized protein (DUF1697 family) [Silicimonas algicola]